jgi:hypothetical protein
VFLEKLVVAYIGKYLLVFYDTEGSQELAPSRLVSNSGYVFGRCSFRISAGGTDCLTEVFRGSLQSLQTNAVTASFQILSSSFL